MGPVKRRGCCAQGHSWRRTPSEAEQELNEVKLEDGRTSRILIFHVVLKVVTCIVAFCLVLCGCVLAKGSLLLMLANMIPTKLKSSPGSRALDSESDIPPSAAAGWYWTVLAVFVVPEIFSFFQAARKIRSRRPVIQRPQWTYVAMVSVMELLHVFGLGMLLFLIFPRLDSFVASTLTLAVILIPSIIRTLYWNKEEQDLEELGERNSTTSRFSQLKSHLRRLDFSACIDLIAVFAQLAAFVYLPIMLLPYVQADEPTSQISHSNVVFYGASLSCALTSCVWWENFITERSALLVLKRLHRLTRKNHSRRSYIQLCLSPIKITVMCLLMMLCYWLNCVSQADSQGFQADMSDLGKGFLDLFRTTGDAPIDVPVDEDTVQTYSISIGSTGVNTHDYWIALLVQMISGFLAVQVGIFGCQTLMQCLTFSLPVILASPVLVAAVGILAHVPDGPATLQYYYEEGKTYPNFKTVDHFNKWTDVFGRSYIWIWMVWFISLVWITRHIWTNRNPVRLAKPDMLFSLPVFTGLLVDQHLACSRRLIGPISCTSAEFLHKLPACVRFAAPTHQRAKVYACVTMWHESKNEMRKLIGSLVGLDERQSKQSLDSSIYSFPASSPVDGYDLECHVFFDDAFEEDLLADPLHQELSNLYSSPLCRDNDCTCPVLSGTSQPKETLDPTTAVPVNGCLNHLAQSTIHVMTETTQKTDIPKRTCPVHSKRTKLELVNSYVKQFWSLLLRTTDKSDCSFSVLNPEVDVKEVLVQYGACYIWKMKNGTSLYLHLKDIKKVKRRKRWSQVMYLHYIENVLMQNIDTTDIQSQKCRDLYESYVRERRAANTFVMALDGDMEFEACTVQLLLDFMKKDAQLGAVCGRVHPTGGGPVVWYQQFEYATSQWLQKTTEQVIGSVLCSPGCFSLYRADALLNHKVIGKYSRKAEEAMECLKYDQGEDRWLCTLMLKAGYRIRYCALAFAKTRAPVSFDELFNQRRRWISSSTANLIEILQDGRKLIKRNEHISYVYIMYQMMQLVSTALSPGVTVLMLDQSLSIAFSIGNLTALTLAVAPILIFTAVCLKAPEKFQLLVAQVLSIAYAILMVGEVVGLAMQFTSTERFTSPTAVLVLLVLSIFLATALLHPRSFPCYFHGLLYFFWIPAMFVLLPIYSLCSLDNLAWGTREEKTKPRDGGSVNVLNGTTHSAGGGFRCSLGPALHCTCCGGSEAETSLPHNASSDNVRIVMAQNGQILSELKSLQHPGSGLHRSTLRPNSRQATIRNQPTSRTPIQDSFSLARPTYSSILQEQEFNRVDTTLQEAELCRFPVSVDVMWTDLLRGRLRPDPVGPPPRATIRLKTKLRELRDRAVLIFFAINALVVALVYLLQNNTDLFVRLPWPWGGPPTTTRKQYDMDEDASISESQPVTTAPSTTTAIPKISRRSFLKYDPDTQSVQVEPIGVLFVLLYVAVLVLQFLCMLVHRLKTFAHLLASTEYTTVVQQRTQRRNSKKIQKTKLHPRDSYEQYRCECHQEASETEYNPESPAGKTAQPEPDSEDPYQKTPLLVTPSAASLPLGMGNGYTPLRMFDSSRDDFLANFQRPGRTKRRRFTLAGDTLIEIPEKQVEVDIVDDVAEQDAFEENPANSVNGRGLLSRQDNVVIAESSILSLDRVLET